MEYYDSVNNNILYSHYLQKNTNFLINPEVITILDKSEKTNGIKINIIENPYKIISQSGQYRNKHSFISSNETTISLKNDLNGHAISLTEIPFTRALTQFDFTKKSTKYNEIKQQSLDEIEKSNVNLDKIIFQMENELNIQKNSFELTKKKRLEKIKLKPRKSKRFITRRGSKIDDVLITASIINFL